MTHEFSPNLDPRRAGEVTRYHTWPRLREQSVGEHSWQVMRILLAVWPDAPRHLLLHCLTHDVGESVSGDPPYPVKALNADLKLACDRIERETHLLMSHDWTLPPPSELTETERCIFKLCEFVEMWEWGLAERAMGNSRAQLAVDRCASAMVAMHNRLYEEIFDMRGALTVSRVRGILDCYNLYIGKREAIDGRHEAHGLSRDSDSRGRAGAAREGGDVSG